jgi:hypothetical protein
VGSLIHCQCGSVKSIRCCRMLGFVTHQHRGFFGLLVTQCESPSPDHFPCSVQQPTPSTCLGIHSRSHRPSKSRKGTSGGVSRFQRQQLPILKGLGPSLSLSLSLFQSLCVSLTLSSASCPECKHKAGIGHGQAVPFSTHTPSTNPNPGSLSQLPYLSNFPPSHWSRDPPTQRHLPWPPVAAL